MGGRPLNRDCGPETALCTSHAPSLAPRPRTPHRFRTRSVTTPRCHLDCRWTGAGLARSSRVLPGGCHFKASISFFREEREEIRRSSHSPWWFRQNRAGKTLHPPWTRQPHALQAVRPSSRFSSRSSRPRSHGSDLRHPRHSGSHPGFRLPYGAPSVSWSQLTGRCRARVRSTGVAGGERKTARLGTPAAGGPPIIAMALAANPRGCQSPCPLLL